MACQVVPRLGFFINLVKRVFIPVQLLTFLGMSINPIYLSFSIPDPELPVFITLRDSILSQRYVDVHTLQRFTGNVLILALLSHLRNFYLSMQQSCWLGTKIPPHGPLAHGITSWRQIDTSHQVYPWRHATHSVLSLSTDASGHAWGASIVQNQNNDLTDFSDYWSDEVMSESIAVKEGLALLNAIKSVCGTIWISRLAILCDNKALVDGWNHKRSNQLWFFPPQCWNSCTTHHENKSRVCTGC